MCSEPQTINALFSVPMCRLNSSNMYCSRSRFQPPSLFVAVAFSRVRVVERHLSPHPAHTFLFDAEQSQTGQQDSVSAASSGPGGRIVGESGRRGRSKNSGRTATLSISKCWNEAWSTMNFSGGNKGGAKDSLAFLSIP